MTIEQKLEILKRAMELGANINFSFHSWRNSINKDGAVELAGQFPEFENEFKEREKTTWIKLGDPNSDFSGSIFYEGEPK